MHRVLLLLLLSLPLLAPAAPGPAPACLADGAECSLREAAQQSGIHVGAALGSAMRPDQIADLLLHFDAFTTENAFKWGEMERSEGEVDFTTTDRMVALAKEHRLRLRAHALFWHRLQTPPWVRTSVEAAPDPALRLRTLMRERVEAVVGRYRGRVALYDVVNEPFELLGGGFDTRDNALSPENFFYTTLGIDYIAETFRLAHAVDPRAKLFLNETVWDPRRGDAKAEALLALVRSLREAGVPIHGVGLQTHGVLGFNSPFFPSDTESFREYLDALGALGVKVEITELDVRLPLVPAPRRRNQAELYRRVVRACALAPACTGVTVWGLRDPDSWLDHFELTRGTAPNRPLLLDADGQPKLAYFAVRDALLERCGLVPMPRPFCSRAWPPGAPRRAQRR
jgi:endo-1,4-beta-xylanase